jgi:hypothetical protein
MGACKYCGRSAGFLKGEHEECSAKHGAGLAFLGRRTQDLIGRKVELNPFLTEVRGIQGVHFLTDADSATRIRLALEAAVDLALADHPPSAEERSWFGEILEKVLGDKPGSHSPLRTKLAFVAMLGNLLDGGPEVCDQDEPDVRQAQHMFQIPPGEYVLWIPGTSINYQKVVTGRGFEGSSQGVSVRVASGLYFRTGASSGHPIESQSMQIVDTGTLVVTTEALYFGGQQQRFRLPYAQILSKDARSDGLLFWRSRTGAAPEAFALPRPLPMWGWLLANIIEGAPAIIARGRDQVARLEEIAAEARRLTEELRRGAIKESPVAGPPVAPAAPPSGAPDAKPSVEERLTRLESLRDHGHITPDEFASRREEILKEL